MRLTFWLIALLALVLGAGMVEAASYSYLHVDYKNLHFEYLDGGQWRGYNVGNYYYGDYWYHIPNRLRYTYLGSYYYISPGWYRFHRGFNYPGYYDFYPVSYYYYSGSFYDSYYYPSYPTAYPNYTGTSYVYRNPYTGVPSVEGTLTQFVPTPTSSCAQLSASAGSITLSPGQQLTGRVTLHNNSGSTFVVSDVSAQVRDFDVRTGNTDFDSSISPHGSGKVTFSLRADSDASASNTFATVRISGHFRDGTGCSGTQRIEKIVNIRIAGSTPSMASGSTASTIGDTSLGAVAVSTSTIVPYTNPGWNETTYTGSAYSGSGNSAGSGYNQTAYENLDPYINYKNPDLYDTGNFVNYEQANNEALFTHSNLTGKSGNSLRLVTQDITVQGGKSRTELFTIKNFSSLDFYVDAVRIVEYAPEFTAQRTSIPSVVYSGQTTTFGVKVSAHPTTQSSTGSATVEVQGHFSDGSNANTGIETFYVHVGRSLEGVSVRDVKIEVPSQVTLSGSQTIPVHVNNPTPDPLVIVVTGTNVQVFPQVLHIQPSSIAERSVTISALQGESGQVRYHVDTPASGVLDKITFVKKPVVIQPPGKVQMVSYASSIKVFDQTTFEVVLKNETASPVEVELSTSQFPPLLHVRKTVGTIHPGDVKGIPVTALVNNVPLGTYNGFLNLRYDGKTEQFPFSIEVVGTEEEAEEEEGGIIGAIVTGFLGLGNTGALLGLGVLIIVVAAWAVYRRQQGKAVIPFKYPLGLPPKTTGEEAWRFAARDASRARDVSIPQPREPWMN